MKFPNTICSASLAAAMAAALLLPAAAQAQSADNPPKAQRAHTLKQPSRSGKVVGSDRADAATRRGVNNVSEKASRPVRNVGEAFGRKLSPGSSGRAAPPPVGPQGNAP